MTPTAVDIRGRLWALVAGDATVQGHLVDGTGEEVVMDLTDLVDTYGPLTMASTPPPAGGLAALVDTVDLVASDPATASVEQIEVVARFARSIVLPAGRRA